MPDRSHRAMDPPMQLYQMDFPEGGLFTNRQIMEFSGTAQMEIFRIYRSPILKVTVILFLSV